MQNMNFMNENFEKEFNYLLMDILIIFPQKKIILNKALFIG